jgi:hypothetical protein
LRLRPAKIHYQTGNQPEANFFRILVRFCGMPQSKVSGICAQARIILHPAGFGPWIIYLVERLARYSL